MHKMKNRNLLIFLVIILLSITMIQCEGKVSASAENEKDQVKQTLIAMWEAIEDEDLAKYASFVHPDFTQFGETDSVLRVGKEAELKGVESWIEEFDDIQTEMIDPKITVKDNVAWIVYYWSDKSNSKGKDYSSRGKSTRIFVKENERWLCIHGHYTLLP